MPFTITFTLEERPDMPAAYKDKVPEGCSRHHIVGQKYLQLLYALCEAAGVAAGTMERFAFKRPPRPEKEMSDDALKDYRREVYRAFVWSPYGLFVGPAGTKRVFDPSSGVEQQRPLSFPENRWLALKRIPQYFEDIGVNLDTLFNLATGATAKWELRRDQKTLAAELTELIKGVAPPLENDYYRKPLPIHGLDETDWGWVRGTDVTNFKPRSRDDVADIHKQYATKIVQTPPFYEALNGKTTGFRFLLLSRMPKV